MTVAELYESDEIALAVAARRARIISAYYRTTDERERLGLAAEAVRYDRTHPDESPLFDELYGANLAEVA